MNSPRKWNMYRIRLSDEDLSRLEDIKQYYASLCPEPEDMFRSTAMRIAIETTWKLIQAKKNRSEAQKNRHKKKGA